MKKIRKTRRVRKPSPAPPPKAVLVQRARLDVDSAGVATLCWPTDGTVDSRPSTCGVAASAVLAEASR